MVVRTKLVSRVIHPQEVADEHVPVAGASKLHCQHLWESVEDLAFCQITIIINININVISTLATSRSTVSRSQTSKDGIGEERVNEEGYKLKTIIFFYFLIWKKNY